MIIQNNIINEVGLICIYKNNTRKHSSGMHTDRLPTVHVLVASAAGWADDNFETNIE